MITVGQEKKSILSSSTLLRTTFTTSTLITSLLTSTSTPFIYVPSGPHVNVFLFGNNSAILFGDGSGVQHG